MTRRKISASERKRISQRVLQDVALGASCRKACADADVPLTTFLGWVRANKDDLERQYTDARNQQADMFADELVEIADTEEDPKRAKVRIWARTWIMGKQKPSRYGEIRRLEHSGPEGGPIVVKIVDDGD